MPSPPPAWEPLTLGPVQIKAGYQPVGSICWSTRSQTLNTILYSRLQVKADYGSVDFLVHSVANGPEVSKPLLQVSRQVMMPRIHGDTKKGNPSCFGLSCI